MCVGGVIISKLSNKYAGYKTDNAVIEKKGNALGNSVTSWQTARGILYIIIFFPTVTISRELNDVVVSHIYLFSSSHHQ